MRSLLVGAFVTVAAGTGLVSALGAGDACAQGGDAVVPRIDCEEGRAAVVESCAATATAFRSVSARPRGRAVRLSFTRRVRQPVRVDLFRVSAGRRVIGNRLVARLRRSGTVRPRGGSGFFFVRFRTQDARGRRDDRRIALRRSGGRFRVVKPFYRRASCGALTTFKLERPVFGGRRNRALGVSFRVRTGGAVTVEVRRRGRLVRRLTRTERRSGVTHRLRLPAERLRRGRYEVRLLYVQGGVRLRTSLFAQRL